MAARASRRSHFPRQPSEDDIDPALIEALPEVEPGQEAVPLWEAHLVPDPSPEPEAEPAAAWMPSAELRDILDALQQDMAASAAQHMARVEETMAAHLADLQARLAEANALIEELREENAALLRQKDAYERAFSTLRDLTRNVEDEAYR